MKGEVLILRTNKILPIILSIILCYSAITLTVDFGAGAITRNKLISHILVTAIVMVLVSMIVFLIQKFFRRVTSFFRRSLFSNSANCINSVNSNKKRCEHDSSYESPDSRKSFTLNDFENPDFDPRFLNPDDIDDYVEYMLKKNKGNTKSYTTSSHTINGVEVSSDEFKKFVLEEMGIDAHIHEKSKRRNKKPRSFRCESCGAPLTPGTKRCPYCESTIFYS